MRPSGCRLEVKGRFRPFAEVQSDNDNADMHSFTAYERRSTLNVDQLHRLRAQLVDEVERYRIAVRGYSPDKMARHGTPYLTKLEARVAEIDAQIAKRA